MLIPFIISVLINKIQCDYLRQPFYIFVFLGLKGAYIYELAKIVHPPVQTTNFSVPLKRRVNLIDNDFSKVQKNHEKNHHKSPIYAIFFRFSYPHCILEFLIGVYACTTSANSGLAKGGLLCFDQKLVRYFPPFAKPLGVMGKATRRHQQTIN